MRIYAGTFITAFATLALEVTLTRLLSVVTWYHLAFFAVSIAMLGMTAGATTVYLRPGGTSEDSIRDRVAKACLGYSVAVPFGVILLCIVPVVLERGAMGFYALVVMALASMLPFYFSGIALTTVLTKSHLPIGKVYASDLAGASAGCLFVLGGLEIFDAPSLIILSGVLGVIASMVFAGNLWTRNAKVGSVALMGGLCVLVALGTFTSYGVKPLVVKGSIAKTTDYVIDKWNSFSRVIVDQMIEDKPQYWGESPLAPKEIKGAQYPMTIDGIAGTTMMAFRSVEDIEHLRFDVTNVVYYLRSTGGAFIVGVGGGRDAQSAILFGHDRVTGIDVNPVFIDLLSNRFREFAGLGGREGVSLRVGEARSYLSTVRETYSVIQMSLIDTWAATGAGAFSLSENGLYTVEAWKIFLARLSEDGIFTVSRWYNKWNLGETGRMLSLAVAALIESGVRQPAEHMAMVSGGRVSTLLVSKSPFSAADLAKLREVCDRLQFSLLVHPGQRPSNEVVAGIVSANTRDELDAAAAGQPFNYEPPTDETPYFFNMLRFSLVLPLPWAKPDASLAYQPGVIQGNILATRTLGGLIVVLAALSVGTILLPLATRAGGERHFGGNARGREMAADGQVRTAGPSTREGGRALLWQGAAYFSLIGAGFMFAEIALIQRLSVFLGHPIYALGIALFTIIAGAGAGSYLSERLPLTRRPWVFIYPVAIALAITGVRFAVSALSSSMQGSDLIWRAMASVALTVPLGMLLGVGFPVGMRLVRAIRACETPWYWGLNGVFSVLSSALVVLVSIYFGISWSFIIAAGCYACVLPCIPAMLRGDGNSTG